MPKFISEQERWLRAGLRFVVCFLVPPNATFPLAVTGVGVGVKVGKTARKPPGGQGLQAAAPRARWEARGRGNGQPPGPRLCILTEPPLLLWGSNCREETPRNDRAPTLGLEKCDQRPGSTGPQRDDGRASMPTAQPPWRLRSLPKPHLVITQPPVSHHAQGGKREKERQLQTKERRKRENKLVSTLQETSFDK